LSLLEASFSSLQLHPFFERVLFFFYSTALCSLPNLSSGFPLGSFLLIIRCFLLVFSRPFSFFFLLFLSFPFYSLPFFTCSSPEKVPWILYPFTPFLIFFWYSLSFSIPYLHALRSVPFWHSLAFPLVHPMFVSPRPGLTFFFSGFS